MKVAVRPHACYKNKTKKEIFEERIFERTIMKKIALLSLLTITLLCTQLSHAMNHPKHKKGYWDAPKNMHGAQENKEVEESAAEEEQKFGEPEHAAEQMKKRMAQLKQEEEAFQQIKLLSNSPAAIGIWAVLATNNAIKWTIENPEKTDLLTKTLFKVLEVASCDSKHFLLWQCIVECAEKLLDHGADVSFASPSTPDICILDYLKQLGWESDFESTNPEFKRRVRILNGSRERMPKYEGLGKPWCDLTPPPGLFDRLREDKNKYESKKKRELRAALRG